MGSRRLLDGRRGGRGEKAAESEEVFVEDDMGEFETEGEEDEAEEYESLEDGILE